MKGSCLCGAVRFAIGLPTAFCAHCHCSMCRRAHGAGYVTWVGAPRSGFRLETGAGRLVRYRSSEHGMRSFCGVCGSSLFCELDTEPQIVDVVLANLDGPIDRAPQAHAYYDSRADWVRIDDDLPRLSGNGGDDRG